jgi:hypothetical protein
LQPHTGAQMSGHAAFKSMSVESTQSWDFNGSDMIVANTNKRVVANFIGLRGLNV